MALTKADMAEKLFEDLGLNKREAKELVEMFFEKIRQALRWSAGEVVRVREFRSARQESTTGTQSQDG